MGRLRADALLVRSGLARSREHAKAVILAGEARADGRVIGKAGEPLDESCELTVEAPPRYVSRGGHKLEHALEVFGIDPAGLIVIDVGASTGGFTDCLLQRGAAGVTAVDVGYGQLAWELRNDPRVRVLERTNIRKTTPASLGAPFDLAVVDVSFVGLAKVLPVVLQSLTEAGEVLALVKPQFEAGKGRVGRRGVVRDAAIHAEVLTSVYEEITALGWLVVGMSWSPLKGPEGNIEFWVRVARQGTPAPVTPQEVVAAAHREFE